MSSWITEGVTTRTRWGHPSPVVHLIVVEPERLWCTGSPGRPATVHHEAVDGHRAPRVCRECARLAAAAVADGTVDDRDVGRFLE